MALLRSVSPHNTSFGSGGYAANTRYVAARRGRRVARRNHRLGPARLYPRPLSSGSAVQLQWPWHWGSWVHRATVTLDMNRVVNGTLDPVEALAAVPADRIASMQAKLATIAEYGHCLHYPRDENKTHALASWLVALRQMLNALDITLQGSWLHKRSILIRRNFSRVDLCTQLSHALHRPETHQLRHRGTGSALALAVWPASISNSRA